jgi:hypothetical protein
MISPRLRNIYKAEPDRAVLEEFGWKVANGPFAGMPYITRSCGSRLAPKIVGCYEHELHSTIEQIIVGGYERIIDIGCAEGYYAVGLARKLGVPVVAFDNNPNAHARLEELATLNGVDALIELRTICTPEDFNEFAGQRVCVICDIEGGEEALLDPDKSPALLGFDLLVEVHDGPDSTRIHDLMAERFKNSHTLKTIAYEGRGPADAAAITWISNPELKLAAVDEQRAFGLEWLYIKRNA